jgi:hypothetical protein
MTSDDSVREKIHRLIELQEIEQRSAALQSIIDKHPRQIETLENRLAEAEAAIAQAKSRLSALQKNYREQESEAKNLLSRIAKSEEKLRSVKTNKEYQSSLKEIDDIKMSHSGIEDRMLEILEEMDAVEAEITAREREYAAEAALIREEKEELMQEVEQKKAELEKLSKKGQAVLDQIDAALLKRYKNVKYVTGTTAVAAVKNAVCLGCNVNIPPQMFNELQRFDRLLNCPFCQAQRNHRSGLVLKK